MAGCNRMAGLSDGFQVRVSISTIEINTQTHLHTPSPCAYALSARKTPMQRINDDELMLNAKEPWKRSSFDVRAFVCLQRVSLWWISQKCCGFSMASDDIYVCPSLCFDVLIDMKTLLTTEVAGFGINAHKTIINYLKKKKKTAWDNYEYNTNALFSNNYSLYTI